MTYTGEGVYVSLGLVCNAGKSSNNNQATLGESFKSVIYAYSKASLYAPTTGNSNSGGLAVKAAVYVVAKAW